ncbi:hypothetical protein D3C84_470450 [compost metagenome]
MPTISPRFNGGASVLDRPIPDLFDHKANLEARAWAKSAVSPGISDEDRENLVADMREQLRGKLISELRDSFCSMYSTRLRAAAQLTELDADFADALGGGGSPADLFADHILVAARGFVAAMHDLDCRINKQEARAEYDALRRELEMAERARLGKRKAQKRLARVLRSVSDGMWQYLPAEFDPDAALIDPLKQLAHLPQSLRSIENLPSVKRRDLERAAMVDLAKRVGDVLPGYNCSLTAYADKDTGMHGVGIDILKQIGAAAGVVRDVTTWRSVVAEARK